MANEEEGIFRPVPFDFLLHRAENVNEECKWPETKKIFSSTLIFFWKNETLYAVSELRLKFFYDNGGTAKKLKNAGTS